MSLDQENGCGPLTKVDPALLLEQSISCERAAFLMRVKVPLAVAGVLVLIPRIANRLPGQWLDGWPTTIIWTVAVATCLYGLYHLLRPRSRAFLERYISAETRHSLVSSLTPELLAVLEQSQPVKVADLERLRATLAKGLPRGKIPTTRPPWVAIALWEVHTRKGAQWLLWALVGVATLLTSLGFYRPVFFIFSNLYLAVPWHAAAMKWADENDAWR